MINITDLSHKLLSEVNAPTIAVDMTCGNGLDTLFMANQAKYVFAFDIQDLAIDETNNLLNKNGINNVKVIKASHELFDTFINQKIDQVIYNLGYLPKGDKSIRTTAKTVMISLRKAVDLLSDSGIIVIVVYLHDLIESKAITKYVSKLSKEFDVMKYEILNKTNSPYIIKIRKNRGINSL